MIVKEKVIVITGAGRGLGRSMAISFAQKGANVAAVDLNQTELDATVSACHSEGASVKSYICDVTQEDQVEDLFNSVVEDFGTLHGLVNNAGIARDGLLVKAKGGHVEKKMSLKQWQDVIDVNLTGTFLCGREAAVKMIECNVDEGVIVNISSVAKAGNYGLTNYSATKAGVATMAEVWAKELARYNIRTGSVAPGIINTELLAATQPAARERWISGIPLRRIGEAEHIANSVTFIFENTYFTGRCIETDGGLR